MDDEASAAATKEVSGGAPSKMERDDTFRDRTEFLNRRVAKNFNGSIYFGTVVEFIDASEAGDGTEGSWWSILYDDGDAEDVAREGLIQGLRLFKEQVPSAPKEDKGIDDKDDSDEASSATVEVVGSSSSDKISRRKRRPRRLSRSEERTRRKSFRSNRYSGTLDESVVNYVDYSSESASGLRLEEKTRRKSSTSNRHSGTLDESVVGYEDYSSESAVGVRSEVKSRRKSSRSKKDTGTPEELSVAFAESSTRLPSKGEMSSSENINEAHSQSKGILKSRAVQHSSPRRRAGSRALNEHDWDSSTDANISDFEAGDLNKIERILASRKETNKKWKEICDKINTSEVENGSRWLQSNEGRNDDEVEERFLIKWEGLSYLHCSWETMNDLVANVECLRPYVATFKRRSRNGLIFDDDERGDGEFFDEKMTEIERILEVVKPNLPDPNSRKLDTNVGKGVGQKLVESSKYDIVLDRSDPRYEIGTGRQFLVKWGHTSYSKSTYEFERDMILMKVEYSEHVNNFLDRSRKPTKTAIKRSNKKREDSRRRLFKIFGENATISAKRKNLDITEYRQRLEAHEFKNGGNLRDYQAEGVCWLMSNYVNGRSSILADEMGLGKTIQVASFINLLASESQIRGPYLIIAPLSTITHWLREFSGWTDLNAIIYHGSARDREVLREFEMPFESDRPKESSNYGKNYLRRCTPGKVRTEAWQRSWMAQVVITTPEMLVTEDFQELTAIKWEVLVVDEAHRMKNYYSKLASNLRDDRFEFGSKILLTGTPIQNNMSEMWTLLNVIDSNNFDDVEDYIKRYGGMKSKERVNELHDIIRPYILRRLKQDVEKSVPPKEETIIEVELTGLQKQYYRALYEKNVHFLHKGRKRSLDKPSLSNLGMQLRKCCNHPFLLRGVEDEVKQADKSGDESEGDMLVKASGKLVLLDKLLAKLKENDHRVLIFSQFKIMLDVLEDYLRSRQMLYERIDGSVTGRHRQMAIDRYQSESTEKKEVPFVMLLSTRAGGVGINLTAADTCIIFDSDWNPQNDLQAQSRCHRIGQTKSVQVYRLLSRKTFEMKMFHMSSLKIGLEQAVLHGLEGESNGAKSLKKKDLERLLRHGAYDLFKEEKGGSSEKESSLFEQQDIDDILSRRAQKVVYENGNAKASNFSKAIFNAVNEGAQASSVDDVDVDDPDFWSKVVGEGRAETLEEDLTNKKRKRTPANYNEKQYDYLFGQEISAEGKRGKALENMQKVEDADFNNDEVSEQTSDSEQTDDRDPVRIQERTRKTVFSLVKNIRVPNKVLKSRLNVSQGKILMIRPVQDLLQVGDEIVQICNTNIKGRLTDDAQMERLWAALPDTVWLTVIRQVVEEGVLASKAQHSSLSGSSRMPSDTSARIFKAYEDAVNAAATVSVSKDATLSAISTQTFRNAMNGKRGESRRDLEWNPFSGRWVPSKGNGVPERTFVLLVTLHRDQHHPTFGVSVASSCNNERHYIHAIAADGAAAAEGTLLVGDELISVDAKPTAGLEWRTILNKLIETPIKQPLRLGILRISQQRSEFPHHCTRSDGIIIANIGIPRISASNTFGIILSWDIERSQAKVTGITEGSPAKRQNQVQLGDLILSVNRQNVMGECGTLHTLLQQIEETKMGQSLFLSVFRRHMSSHNNVKSVLGKKDANSSSKWASKNQGDQIVAPSVSHSKEDQLYAIGSVALSQARSSGKSFVSPNKNLIKVKGVEGHLIEGITIHRKNSIFGLTLKHHCGLTTVSKIRDASQAQYENIIIEDRLLSVNRTNVINSTLSEVLKQIRGIKEGDHLVMNVLRPLSNATDQVIPRGTAIRGIVIHRRIDEASFGVYICHRSRKDRLEFFVSGIAENGASAREGTLKKNDVIQSVNRVNVTLQSFTFDKMLELIRSTKPGHPLILGVYRESFEEEGNSELSIITARQSDDENYEENLRNVSANPNAFIEMPMLSSAREGDAEEGNAEEGNAEDCLEIMPSAKGDVQAELPKPQSSEESNNTDFPEASSLSEESDAVAKDAAGKHRIPQTIQETASETGNKETDNRKEVRATLQALPQAQMSPLTAKSDEVCVTSGMSSTFSRDSLPTAIVVDKASTAIGRGNPETKQLSMEFSAEAQELVSTPADNPPKDDTPKDIGDKSEQEDMNVEPLVPPMTRAKKANLHPSPMTRAKKATLHGPVGVAVRSPHKASSKPTSESASARQKRIANTCVLKGCKKAKQHGAEGMCIRHWTLRTKNTIEKDGKGVINKRVAKEFEDGVYYGTITAHYPKDTDNEVALWEASYDDGDAEDYDIDELMRALFSYNETRLFDPQKNPLAKRSPTPLKNS